jgi:hypothetical protein
MRQTKTGFGQSRPSRFFFLSLAIRMNMIEILADMGVRCFCVHEMHGLRHAVPCRACDVVSCYVMCSVSNVD